MLLLLFCSNNTNKLSPQEPLTSALPFGLSSNNTNKLSPQEHHFDRSSFNLLFK